MGTPPPDANDHRSGGPLHDIFLGRTFSAGLADAAGLEQKPHRRAVTDVGASGGIPFTMDDLDHSVYMAEQDWDSFFQESEECNLQQGALAGLDDSGLSDFDEAEFCLSSQEVRASLESGPLGTHRSIDSPSDLEGLPVKPPESTKDLHGPEDVLAAGGSEETVNVFSERTVISGEDEDPAKLSCGDDLCLRSANVSQANSAENLSNQTFPEFLRPPLDLVKGEAQELDSEETLAEDSPTASLSAVESPDCNIQSIMEDESVLPKEPGTCTEDLVSRELDPVLDSTRPVYAISSFWDEMEKLTINDILHLRLVSNARRPSDLPRVQDAAVADASDAADSGYFAHPDDSKPDRWAGDTSLYQISKTSSSKP
ncbi:hypothetical protein ANANG_G00246060 [Anguilla anguilla]|uniref:Uncharacterized protein n=1 Tax=Anguilla anguilla TaxID=7936 RepID=A0A9D3LUX2_ANGAN|nr:hypothetical protein ANANG_G00246060 [Anguilla anguilla]